MQTEMWIKRNFVITFMMKFTTDHDEIRLWIVEHNGIPVIVKGVYEGVTERLDIISLGTDPDDFDFLELDWEEFFARFEPVLGFVYDTETKPGILENFILLPREEGRIQYAAPLIEKNTLPDSGDEEATKENLFPDYDPDIDDDF